MSLNALQNEINARIEIEKQLKNVVEELQRVNKELDALSFTVSHDLRAPLRAIDGFSKIILEKHADNLDQETQRLLTIIRQNTMDMTQLIEDLMGFSQLNRQEMNMMTINMQKLVEETYQTFKENIGDRRLILDIKSLPEVVGDPVLIRHVWTNLLSNAFKFTRVRKLTTIEIGSFIKDQECVYYIKDNGVGFNMQYIHKLFGIFQRLHASAEFEGTGIGLAIVRRIVNRHKGQVWAESKSEEGSIFYFSIPRNEK